MKQWRYLFSRFWKCVFNIIITGVKIISDLRPVITIENDASTALSLDYAPSNSIPRINIPRIARQYSGNRVSSKKLRRQGNLLCDNRAVLLFWGMGVESGGVTLDVNGDAEAIRAALVKNGCLKLAKRNNVQRKNLVDSLDRLRPRVIHFDGHGGENVLAMSDKSVSDGYLYGDEIKMLLELEKGHVDLVYFDACNSLSLADDAITCLPSAIGVNGTINADDARKFSVQFYKSLSSRKSIAEAYDATMAHFKLTNVIMNYPLLRAGTHYPKGLTFFTS